MAASGQSQGEGSIQGMVVDRRGRLTRPRIGIRERLAAVRETAYNSDNTDLLASSEMECESFSMEWSLRNYSVLSSHQEIFSPMFFSPKSNHTCWQLRVCPRKKKQKSQADDDVEHLSVHLILKELRNVNDNPFIPPCPVRARYQIMLLNANDGSPHLVFGDSDMPVIEFKLNSEWGWDQLIPSHQLTCPRMRLLVNNDDILRIRCNIWIEEGLKHNIISSGSGINYLPTDQERAARRKERFLEDFEKLYKKYVNADFEIWVGPEKIKVHKVVLAARSPIFALMFTQGAHVDEDKMIIKDFDVTTVKAMLNYIYTGNVDKTIISECATDLLQIGEKFELLELKEMCAEFLCENILVSNATSLSVLGQLFHAPVLKSRAMDFINRHKEEVKQTADFKKAVKDYGQTTNIFLDLYLA